MRFRLLLVVSFAALSVACRPENAGGAPRAPAPRRLPEHAAPRGAVRTFDIEAREAELPLIDGGKLRVWAYNGRCRARAAHPAGRDAARPVHEPPAAADDDSTGTACAFPTAMDGVPHVTQPPVEPGGSFTYEFTPKDAGTFWFHPTSVPASRSSAASTAC
jgi:FtsP/CotA-like multicopper oxidase with cupredoxin domain